MKKLRLMDQVRMEIRTRNYSPRTEEAYTRWIKQYILFHNKQHPNSMSEAEIRAFLLHLVNDKQALQQPTIRPWPQSSFYIVKYY